MFSRTLLRLYPNIYMFEISQRIAHDDRSKLEARMRAAGYPDFTIHEFGYDSDRLVRVSATQPAYQPIVFMEPQPADARDVLGLDLNSTSGVLGNAARQSLGRLEKVSSLPFELIEGGHGYIIYGPVVISNGIPQNELQLKSGLFALVVVKTSLLLPGWVAHAKGLTVQLRHTGAPSPEDGIVAGTAGPAGDTRGLGGIFEPLRRQLLLRDQSQPFELAAERQVNWEDIDTTRVWVYAITLLTTLPLAMLASYVICRQRRLVGVQRQLIHQRANFDMTTGLPNKHLLQDRVEQAILHARRNGTALALLFIDLDRFKSVNDHWGHAAGDTVLKLVGERITAAIRAEDTVGRIHGDEYLVLLSNIGSPEAADGVMQKIGRALDAPLIVGGRKIQLGMSLGAAFYPQDGEDFERLLQVSDRRMYAVKRATGGNPSD
jgi:diguanylate cyclase (GGDEF)-like protein